MPCCLPFAACTEHTVSGRGSGEQKEVGREEGREPEVLQVECMLPEGRKVEWFLPIDTGPDTDPVWFCCVGELLGGCQAPQPRGP